MGLNSLGITVHHKKQHTNNHQHNDNQKPLDNKSPENHRSTSFLCSSISSSDDKLRRLGLILLVIFNVSAGAAVSGSCEPRFLENYLPPPDYDLADLTISTARDFTKFLFSTRVNGQTSNDGYHKKANELAAHALRQDRNLLAFAIAAPTVPIAVIQFRDLVRPTSSSGSDSLSANHTSYLSLYWRELGSAWNQSDGAQVWGAPFKDCGLLQGRWLWPFSITTQQYAFRVVTSAFIAADTDPCNEVLAQEIFGTKPKCEKSTTKCVPNQQVGGLAQVTSLVGVADNYLCLCQPGFYLPNQTLQGFHAEQLILSSPDTDFNCLPCPSARACVNSDETSDRQMDGRMTTSADGLTANNIGFEIAATMSLETLMRSSIGAILGASMLCCLVLAALVFRQRKCKTIATGMWTVLETILLGILLLYAAVALHFLEASTLRCLLEPWFRELGFVICYGAIILKLYRHLIEFRTRKAHRWVVRDLDLLKYLCAMIVAVLCYLSAFTASSIDFLEHGMLGLELEQTNLCRPLKWDYVTQAGELFILTFGLYLSYISRNAKTQFRERQFLVASIALEFIVSSNFYLLRAFYLPDMSPGTLFIALFIRSQLTNTITMGLLFFPKLWYQHKQNAHDSTHRGGASGCGPISLTDPDIGDLTLSEMNPEDIRTELKRLYTQLEVLKNKTLRLDNPHISKRRGGRKVAHRRFSLQKKGSKDKALSAKHRHRHTHDIEVTEAEPSRTPEDSVCSAEGPTDTGELSGVSAYK